MGATHYSRFLHIGHTIFQRKWKFHLKIPAREWQHCLQSNLSQIHSYHGVKRPKKKRKSNLWEVCFSSTAVVSKLQFGCLGHFLFYFVPLQSTSTQCNMHGFRCSCRELHEMCQWSRDLSEFCTLTVYGSNTFIQISSHLRQFLKGNYQNSTWKSLHMSCNIVYNKICHKYIHIWGEKTKLVKK